jgi:hypothetical protein
MRKILLGLLVFAVSINSSIAQETEAVKEKKFSLSGTVDTYFRANLNGPNDEDAIAPGSSFANLPGFALGMANLIVAYEGEKVGFVADLVYGPRGADAVFGSTGTANIVNQLYAYWNVTDKLTLTMGNFNTFLGYEVISPAANFNYSTSYLFSYGPFSHTGIKADIALSEKVSLMLAIMNPTDATEFNPTGNYTFGAQLGFSGQYLNLVLDGGAYEVDFTGGFDISDTFFFGLNAAYYDDDGVGFAGAAIYPQLATSDSFTLGFRGEYFAESGDFGAIGTGVEDSSVFAATITGSYAIGDLTIKPEFRIDNASEDAFIDNDMMATKSLSSVLVAAIYSF